MPSVSLATCSRRRSARSRTTAQSVLYVSTPVVWTVVVGTASRAPAERSSATEASTPSPALRATSRLSVFARDDSAAVSGSIAGAGRSDIVVVLQLGGDVRRNRPPGLRGVGREQLAEAAVAGQRRDVHALGGRSRVGWVLTLPLLVQARGLVRIGAGGANATDRRVECGLVARNPAAEKLRDQPRPGDVLDAAPTVCGGVHVVGDLDEERLVARLLRRGHGTYSSRARPELLSGGVARLASATARTAFAFALTQRATASDAAALTEIPRAAAVVLSLRRSSGSSGT